MNGDEEDRLVREAREIVIAWLGRDASAHPDPLPLCRDLVRKMCGHCEAQVRLEEVTAYAATLHEQLAERTAHASGQ